MSYTTLVLDCNKMIETFKAIQAYIESVKDADYPTFKGVCKNICHGLNYYERPHKKRC